MTTFEKRSDQPTYGDRDSHLERDSHAGRASHQQRAGVATAGNVMSIWTVAFYDYAEQVLKAQRQFADRMLGAAAPMLNVALEVMSPDVNKDRSANSQMDARGGQRHDGSDRSRTNERYTDDMAEYTKRSTDNNLSDDRASNASRTERANTQAEESAKTQSPIAAKCP
jgi:hypothetical protein